MKLKYFFVCMALTMQAASLDQKIEQYILDHPDVIVRTLEAQSQKEMNEKIQAVVAASPADIAIINPRAPNRLVAFVDYRCGACKRSFEYIKSFATQHLDVALVIRPLPILGVESTVASLMVYDANEENHALRLIETLFSSEKPLDDVFLAQVAQQNHLQVAAKPTDHWAFKYLAENYRQSSMMNNQSVPLYILSVNGKSEMFSGISSRQVLEEAYQKLK